MLLAAHDLSAPLAPRYQVVQADRLRSECRLFTFGAHITSWKVVSDPPDPAAPQGQEMLWMSSLSALDGSAPIRGGIPIAFPQFADTGPMKLHGFAREKVWDVLWRETVDGCDRVSLSLSPDEDIRGAWGFDYDFRLCLQIELTADSLHMALTVDNESDASFLSFSGCFHTYFRTSDIRGCEVSGLEGLEYIDKVEGYTHKSQRKGAPLDISAEASGCTAVGDEYFIDRIYTLPCEEDSRDRLVLTDRNSSVGAVVVEKSASWPNWVVFNPWEVGKRGTRGPDFDNDGYNYMVCLEPTVALEPTVVRPNGRWTGSQTLTIRKVA